MNPKQIVDLLEDQPYYTKSNKQKFIVKQPVVIKSNDDKNLQLNTLIQNESYSNYTQTTFPSYQTYLFTRIYNLCKIIGTLYHKDGRKYQVEIEYKNYDNQWETLYKGESVYKEIYIEFPQPLPTSGIRFRGKSNVNDYFLLHKLNIFAEIGYPVYEGDVNYYKQQLQILLTDYNKKKIINILEGQPFYKIFCNKIFISYKQMITILNDESNNLIQEITNNNYQSVSLICLKERWLTFQFPKKFKLKQITVSLNRVDKQRYNYEIQLLNKDKQWITLEKAIDQFRDININFIQAQSAIGLRIQGYSDPNPNIHIQHMAIWAEQGLPLKE